MRGRWASAALLFAGLTLAVLLGAILRVWMQAPPAEGAVAAPAPKPIEEVQRASRARPASARRTVLADAAPESTALRTVALGVPDGELADGDTVPLGFTLELGGRAPQLRVHNRSHTRFLGRALIGLFCHDEGQGRDWTQWLTLRNLPPLERARLPLEEGAQTCESSSRRRLQLAEADTLFFEVSEQGLSDAALELFGDVPGEREAAAVDFIARHFSPRAGRALILLSSRGNHAAAQALARAAPKGKAFLLEALAELESDDSYLTALLRTPDELEPLARKLPGLEPALREEAERALQAEEQRWPYLTGMTVAHRARTHDRVWPREPRAIESRRIAGRVAVIEALGEALDADVARGLLETWANADERSAASILAVLAKRPEVSVPPVLERLRHPTGNERRFIGEDLLDNALEGAHGLRRALERSAGGPLPWAELRSAHLAARAARVRTLLAQASLSPTPEESLARTRDAVALGAPPDAPVPHLLALARRAEQQGDFETVHGLSESALALDLRNTEARGLRERAESAFLGRLFQSELLYEGPGPEFQPLRPTLPVRDSGLPQKDGFRVVQHGPALLFAPPERPGRMDLVFARLESAQRLGLRVPGARWFYARAWVTKWLPRTLWCVLGALLGAALVTIAHPRGAVRLLLGLGCLRAGARLAALAYSRRPTPGHAALHAEALIERARSERARKEVLLAEARTSLVLQPATDEVRAFLCRVAFLSGNRSEAARGYRALLADARETRLARRLVRMARLDLARTAYAEGDMREALKHARLAGRRGYLVEGLACWRSGRTRARPFLLAALWAEERGAARALLAHALIETERLVAARAVLLFGGRREPRALYAWARLCQARGKARAAKAAYARLASLRSTHGAAQLGLALLEEGQARQVALRSLSTHAGDAGRQARVALAREALQAGASEETLRWLGSGAAVSGSAEECELVALAQLRLARHAESARAFERADGLRDGGRTSSSALLEERCAAVAAAALAEGDAQGALEALGERPDARGMRRHAVWTLVLERLRLAPTDGLEAALAFACGSQAEPPPPPPGVPLAYCGAVSSLMNGEFDRARGRLAGTDEPLASFVGALLSPGAVPPMQLRHLGERVRAAHPSVAGLCRMLEALALHSLGQADAARTLRDTGRARPELGDPSCVAEALLTLCVASDSGANLGEGTPLTKAFAHAAAGRFSEAGAEVDVCDGTPSASLLRVRLGWAAAAARNRLASGDETGARAELQKVLPAATERWLAKGPSPRVARQVERLRRALHELSSMEWPALAQRDPEAALALFEARSSTDEDLRSFIRHDRAILALTACLLREGKVDRARVSKVLVYVEELMRSRRTLARYRLRVLELGGVHPSANAVPHSEGSIEGAIAEEMVRLVAAALGALAEDEGTSALRDVLQPRIRGLHEERATTTGARRALETGERTRLLAALAECRRRFDEVAGVDEARALWEELDAALTQSLERLEALGAMESTRGDCVDQAVQLLDFLSVELHERFPGSGLPIEVVDKALALTRADWLRSHLHKNRLIMSA